MTFSSPLWLFLLLLLPLFAWLGWPAGTARRQGGNSSPIIRLWEYGRGREGASLALRLLIVVCLVLSLAGLEIVQGGNNLAVVFLVDVSDSLSKPAVAAEMNYLRGALKAMGPDDQSALVLFGADALVERGMSSARELGPITSAPFTNQTDLAAAIRLGMALFPPGAARRMVILSDGAQTSGDARKAAEFAAASGVQIISLPFVTQPGAEALVSAVDAPAHLRPGEKFDLEVTIQASQPQRAVLRVLAGDRIVYEQPHDLRRGQQTFSLPLTAGSQGFVNYQVQIAPQQDSFYQNNRLDAFSQVDGPPRILVVAPPSGELLPNRQVRPDEAGALVRALQAAGFTVDVSTPSVLPADLPGLARFNSVVLVDVPASALSTGQMENLQSYVRDLGGGLVAVGGPTSYGVGGYFGTPLEAALPVNMQIKDEKRRPSLAIVFIIDHSGSMGEQSGGVDKLELAKEAAARAVELLFPNDRVGVIAFDDAASWVVPMTDLSNPSEVTSAIGSIQVGGGTDILAGLQAMAKILPGDPAKVKHVILLTDGGADPTGIPELVSTLNAENGITLSTVGVGQDAAPFLKDLAALGGGRYHFTTDPASIPSIFTEETALAMRAYIVEESFFPSLSNPSPILAGIDSVPHLYGYVATSAKDLAQTILKSDKGDPILAAWQYGLGRSVAFTSDATGRWGRDWVAWPGYATFWAQAVRYTIGDISATALETSVSLDAQGQARLSLDARSRNGSFLNGYEIQANVVAPDGATQSVPLHQVAPGCYEGAFDPKDQGVYLMRFSGQPGGGSGEAFAETSGWTLSYSPEYRTIDPNPDLLLRLAAMTGGDVAPQDPAGIFTHDLSAAHASRPVWPWLLALAALLLPFDVASRRLILTRRDFARFVEWLRARLRRGGSIATPLEGRSSPGMDALFQAKQRVPRVGSAPPPVESAAPPLTPPTTGSASAPPVASPPTQAENRPETPAMPESTTASLLARKKAARDKRERP